EDLLRSKKPGLTIPYWNYAEDQRRPDWVWKPPQVTRGTPGAAGGSLPTAATVDNLVHNTGAYTTFTKGIEFDAHNQVHNWCNGTISSPPTAAKDPIFWLLHSNVDRHVGFMAAQPHGDAKSRWGRCDLGPVDANCRRCQRRDQPGIFLRLTGARRHLSTTG